MSIQAARTGRASGSARASLRARLEERREEIEAAALTRIAAIADPSEIADAAYAEGLRRAVPAAIAFGIETIDAGDRLDAPIPVDLLAQARLAARNGIPLDTVLRRYFAGYSLLGYFLNEEAGRGGLLSGGDLQRLTAAQAARFDRLLAAVGEEHAREANSLPASSRECRLAERVERLLVGEPVETADITYDFEGWHVGVVAGGPEAEGCVRRLAGERDCRLLCVPREGNAVWGWLGARSSPDDALAWEQLFASPLPAGVVVAVGEPGEGLPGWRFTHRQAAAALPIAQRSRGVPMRYADVALLAATVKDETLMNSLRQSYLAPLEAGRDRGGTAFETLRAYFAAVRNATSAAAALAISRQAFNDRLRLIEERLGRSIDSCGAELELALQVSAFDRRANRKS